VILVEFSDSEKENIFKKILQMYDKKEFHTFAQIKNKLIGEYNYSKILDVILEMEEINLLNVDNFEADNDIMDSLKEKTSFIGQNKSYTDISEIKLGFIGEKELGEKIKEKALDYGYSKIEIQTFGDHIKEQNIKQFFENKDFVIVDISIWNPYYLDIINSIAIELNRPWLLIEGIVDTVNYSIGPIFHGRDTGCYECYRNRLKSNDEFLPYNQSYEIFLRNGKKASKPDAVPKLVKDIVSSIVVVDISKFIGGWYIPETWKANLMFNTQDFMITKHHFLKAPVCPVCNPTIDYNPHPWLESVTLK
jgi:bacteriocin biosynthesis cyclodehydratase domain-containing protein